jgi:tetratricopeptide (TPR) repeat protein
MTTAPADALGADALFERCVAVNDPSGPARLAADLAHLREPFAVLAAACDRLDASALADLDRSLRTAAALVAVARACPPAFADRATARALLSAAHTAACANRFDEALASIAEASERASRAGDGLLEARTRMALVHPLSRLGRVEEAIAAATSAREAFARHGDVDLVAKADANLGVLCKVAHRFDEALRHFDRALPSFRTRPPAFAQLESNRGEVLLELGRFADAEAAFRAALAVLEANGIHRAAAIVEGNLADLLGRLGRVSDACRAYERARRLHESTGARGDLARLQAEQAELFAAAGLHDEARRELVAAVEGLEATGLVAEARRARRALAAVLLRQRRPRAALDAIAPLAQDRPLGQSMTPFERALVDRHRGEALAALGAFEPAFGALEAAIAGCVGRPIERGIACGLLAGAALARGDDARAAVAIDEGIACVNAAPIAALEAELLRQRAALRSRKGLAGAAVADLRRAADLVDRSRSALQAERFRSCYAASTGAIHEAHAAAILASGTAEPRSVFEAIERGRHRTLLDRLAGGVEDAAEGDVATRSTDPIASEAMRLTALVNGWLSRAADAGDTAAWRDRLADAEERLRVLEARRAAFEMRSRPSAATSDALDPTKGAFDAARAALPPRSALVSWLVADDLLHAVVVRADGAWIVSTGAATASVAAAIEAWEFQIARRLGDRGGRFAARLAQDAVAALDRLGDLLLAPLDAVIGDAVRVQHVPCGLLHAVPFHALRVGGRYAIERSVVATAPSAGAFASMAARSRRTGGALVVGVGDDAAPDIEVEAAEVARSLGDATVLLGRAATVAAVSAAAAHASRLHLACHGRCPPGSPRSAGLRLADGWITTREIERWRLAGASVVVSACDAGRSTRIGGDETVGLVQSLLGAGAVDVVVAGWPVHDATTRAAMNALHAAAGRDRPLAGALRIAMLDAIGRDLHPALWAPFTVTGTA